MRSRIPGIRAAAYSAIWAMREDKLHAVLDFIDLRAEGKTLNRAERQARGIQANAGTRQTYRSIGTVAVIPIKGVIAHHAGMEMDISGGTSTESLHRAFNEAMANPEVSAIVFDCDSPGGTVEGVTELASAIYSARGKGKKLVASVNAHCHSAAYWLASQCDEICITPSGATGDIGVMTMRTDISGAEKKAGIERTLIKAGKYKGEGHPTIAPTDAELDARSAQVREVYEMFAGAVARGRGVTIAQVENGMGEGRSLLAKAALEEGLVDRIETFAQTVTRVSGQLGQAPRRQFAAQFMDAIHAETGETMDAEDDTAVDEGISDRQVALSTFDRTAALSATATTSPIAAGAAPPGITLPPITQTTQPESPVDNKPDLVAIEKAAMEAAAVRARDISALCESHNISPTEMVAFISSDKTVAQVGLDIAALKRAERGNSANITPVVSVGAERETQKPWETMGHFAAAVQDFFTPGSKTVDPRLQAAALGVNQSVPSEGGMLVPPQFSTKIWDEAAGDVDDLLGMTDQYTIEGESLTFNANAETSRATGSRFGGVQGYWINEADQITRSRPKFRQLRLEPQELAVLIYATDKSLRNSPVALGSYLGRAATEEIKFLSGNAIFAGTGAGQPLGIKSHSATISVAKETNQAAATIVQENIAKMWARLHPRARAGAVWLLNADCEPQLDLMNTTVKNVAGTENVGGYAAKLYDPEKRTLKGRPIVTCEYAETLGTVGDIVLANLGWYATGVRGSGVRADVSMHLRFDYAEQAFRFMYELDGQPWLASAITPFKGAATQTAVVTLATRA